MIDIQSSQARAFNPHLRAASANMQTLIGNITADIQQFEEDHGLRVRSSKAQDEVTFRHMVEAILCDLPIHDAVLVAKDHKAPTQDIMRTVFRDHTGLSPKMS